MRVGSVKRSKRWGQMREREGVAWMGASLCLAWHKFSWHKFALSLPSRQRRGRERVEGGRGGGVGHMLLIWCA